MDKGTEEYEAYRRWHTFEVDPSDYDKLLVFEKHHRETCMKDHPDVLGALLSYTFIPTGLGLACTVSCPCGEKIYLSGGLNF